MGVTYKFRTISIPERISPESKSEKPYLAGTYTFGIKKKILNRI